MDILQFIYSFFPEDLLCIAQTQDLTSQPLLWDECNVSVFFLSF